MMSSVAGTDPMPPPVTVSDSTADSAKAAALAAWARPQGADAVGRRLVKDSTHFGTVRFYGRVPADTSVDGKLWLGVEWDDPTRGKHGGEHEDVQYFQWRYSPTACSFVKPAAPALDYGQPFIHALLHKYTTTSNDDLRADKRRQFGDSGVRVEMVGFDKVFQKQSKLHALKEVGLAGMRIAGVGLAAMAHEIGETVPDIRDLDLSRNLLGSWEALAEICGQMPRLESLRVGFNRLARPVVGGNAGSCVYAGAFSNVKALSLDRTFIQWEEIQMMEPYLPHLETLHLGFNGMSKLGSGDGDTVVGGFARLKLLSLESNTFESWSQVLKLRRLPSLEQLYLQQNQLTTMTYCGDALDENGCWPRLKFLNVNENRISEWLSVNELARFPSLKDLRFCRNPLVDEWDHERIRVQVLGRLGRIQTLNGSVLRGRDRVDAELYYLKGCMEERTAGNWSAEEMRALHPRYEELVELHGEPAVEDKRLTSKFLKDRLVLIVIHHGDKVIEKRLPKSTIVRNLKNIIQRLTGVTARAQHLTFHLESAHHPAHQRMALDDDLRTLSFYSIDEHCHVLVEEMEG